MTQLKDLPNLEPDCIDLSKWDGKTWKHTRSFKYITKEGHEIVIPAGEKTDGISVYWRPFSKGIIAALFHDHLLKTRSRRYADKVFLEILDLRKINPLKKWSFFLCVSAWSIMKVGIWRYFK